MALYTAEIERQWIFAISSLFLSLLHLEEQWNIPRYTCVPLSIPKCLPIFSKFFRINGKKENLNSRNTYLEIFLRFPYKLFVSIKRRDYFPFPSFLPFFFVPDLSQTSNMEETSKNSPRVFSSARKCHPRFHFQLDIHQARTRRASNDPKFHDPRNCGGRGVVTILRHRAGCATDYAYTR